MFKNLLFFMFIFFGLTCFSQGERKIFNGKIINDSIPIKNIHVVNKNSGRGVLSNKFGDFQIHVKVNDTLFFSGVQYKVYHKIISRDDLRKLQTIIKLKPNINELKEVIIKPISIAKRLKLPNADKKPLTKLEARLNGHTKASTPLVILGTLIGGIGGIDNLYYVLSGKRKKDRKLKKLQNDDKLKESNLKTVKRIRIDFTDIFFTKTLKIPSSEIENFIEYCLKNNLINLYNKDRKLEIIEIFINESKPFLKEIEKG